jgi:hypothetical protein
LKTQCISQKIILIYQYFQEEEIITLRKTGLYFRIEETYVTAKRIPSKLESECHTICSTIWIECDSWRNTPCLSLFSTGETFKSEKLGLYSWIEETHVAARRILSKLESWVSYSSFRFENLVSLWKHTTYLSEFSSRRNKHFRKNRAILQN